MFRRAATAALAFIIALALGAVTTHPAQAQTYKEKILYDFNKDGGAGGANPNGSLIFDAQGNLYGTTYSGGSGNGVAFKLDPVTGTETVLHNFTCSGGGYSNCPFGALPDAGVIFDAQEENLYGVTYVGVGNTFGAVFKLDLATRKMAVLHTFTGGADESHPNGLIMDAKGNLYGTTMGSDLPDSCQHQDCGTVFEVSPPTKKGGKWTETVLHTLQGGKDGANPGGSLIFDDQGNLYGTTWPGGLGGCYGISGNFTGCGTVFKLDPTTRKETILYSFTGAEGAEPMASLIFDKQGNLYGTTYDGGNPACWNTTGSNGCGTVFKLAPNSDGTWTETVLYAFCQSGEPCADGHWPNSALTMDAQGNLYSTTGTGGIHGGAGTVFKLDPATGTETTLCTFSDYKKGVGAYPEGGVIFDKKGNLYGTTYSGPNGGTKNGTVYKLTP
jgi:uncharacterized repeat protein (TIGR03803 family)